MHDGVLIVGRDAYFIVRKFLKDVVIGLPWGFSPRLIILINLLFIECQWLIRVLVFMLQTQGMPELMLDRGRDVGRRALKANAHCGSRLRYFLASVPTFDHALLA